MNATELVPGYRGIALLAEGHRMETWDAWDEDRGTRCVVKVLREERRGEKRVRDAVLQEGRIVTTLAHPHLVRGYEVVDEPPAVVLETLRGETLSAVIEEGRLAVEDVAELGLQLASVLGYLHRHEWLHLDVKPDNVVNDHGRAVLIDLSLAGRPGDGHPGSGTRGYLAPEQARGRDLSTATDVWGLGVTLLECLSGETPYGDEATWDSRRRWPILHRRAPGPPTIPDHLPTDLHDVLAASVELDPARRPSLAEVAVVLGRHAVGPRVR